MLLGSILATSGRGQGVAVEAMERFALAEDRAKALEEYVPGSPEHAFHACLLAQHEGRFDDAERILEEWRSRHGRGGTEQDRIELRQALLRYREDPAASFEYLLRRFDLSFQKTAEGSSAQEELSTRLESAEFTREAWLREALAQGADGIRALRDEALPSLVARELSDQQVVELLRRLERPDVPGVVQLVARELGLANAKPFGSRPVHGRLLLDQLEELAGLRPELLETTAFVETVLRRLAPAADADTSDLAVRAAYLDRLERFAARLGSAFDGLKAVVRYHRLALDLRRDEPSVEHAVAYLRTARQRWVHPDLERGAKPVRLDEPWPVDLPRVQGDDELVRDYLVRLFADLPSFAAFEGVLRRDYVEPLFAEAKLVAGAPDVERWTALIGDAAALERLRDRVELQFPPSTPERFQPGETASIPVDVKNVGTLIVRVFEVDTVGFYDAQRGSAPIRDVDTTLDLTGLVPHAERSLDLSAVPPMHRVRRTLALPECERPGAYVVELIGNGLSSRAVIRRGDLTLTERHGAVGHVLRVFDDRGEPAPDAVVRLGGRMFTADERGRTLVPFTDEPGRRQVVVQRGSFAVLRAFEHHAEVYSLQAGVHVQREELLAGQTAHVVVRPRLALSGEHVPISLLRGVVLELVAQDIDGSTTTQQVRDLALDNDLEAVHAFAVPPRLQRLSVTLRAKVQLMSTGEEVALASETAEFQVNALDTTAEVEAALLMGSAAGYTIEVRGKNGEPIASRPLHLTLFHRDFVPGRTVSLRTDERGRADLGALEGIAALSVGGVGRGIQRWSLEPTVRTGATATLHVAAGVTLRVPHDGAATQPTRALVSLLELRSGVPAFDRFDRVRFTRGYLVAEDLAPGDYALSLHEHGAHYLVRVAAGRRVGGDVVGDSRRLELSSPLELTIGSASVEDEALIVQLYGHGVGTRVHVAGSRYVPTFDPHEDLALGSLGDRDASGVARAVNRFESGREISDEYRYVLDRRQAPRFPGNMLARAGLLLNPWVVDETTRDERTPLAREGRAFGGPSDSAAPAAKPKRSARSKRDDQGLPAPDPNLDFLAESAVVLTNLLPDAQGVVRIPVAALGAHGMVRVVAVDDDTTVSRTVLLPEAVIALRDRTLATSLDLEKHFVEARRFELVEAGQEVHFVDAANVQAETYDTLGDVYRYFVTRDGGAELARFEFLTRWPALPREEQLAKYSEFACHELHIFLRKRDPEFFRDVVAPYLANKAHKTFLDDWLLQRDLARYLEPWAFAELNTLERILLLRDRPDVGARHVRDLVERMPAAPFALASYFDSVMLGSALDADGSALSGALATLSKQVDAEARAALEKRRGAGGGGGNVAAGVSGPSTPGPTAPSSPSGAAPSRGLDAEDSNEPTGSDDFFLGKNVENGALEADAALRFDSPAELEDLRRGQRAFYRTLPPTAELAERDYWRVLRSKDDATLVLPNPFWVDFAETPAGMPFVSTKFPLAVRSHTEMLLALALLDLPFEAGEHTTTIEGQGVRFTAASRLALARKGLVEVQVGGDTTPILVGQDLYLLSEPYVVEGGRQRDRFVTGELVKGRPYGCRVVVTNPTSAPLDIEVLLQIPEGSLPVSGGFFTRGVAVTLDGYASRSFEYSFYFPNAGEFRHYPAHVGDSSRLAAFAAPRVLQVVETPTVLDTTSWEHVSQRADADTVLEFLRRENPFGLELGRIAWRMRDAAVWRRTVDVLRERLVFDEELWSFALLHRDERGVREYLGRRAEVVHRAGPWLRSPLLDVDPVRRRFYEHLEYDPLVNARAHQFGGVRRILNADFAQQYAAFLQVLTFKPELDDEDRLELVYYLTLQDRVAEALASFARIDPTRLEERLQYDYMRAYLAFFSPNPDTARDIAERYVDHPVGHWRARFRDVLVQLDEASGLRSGVAAEEESRERSQDALAASEATLELHVEAGEVTLIYANVDSAEVSYRPMDVELLFSTTPFLQTGGGAFRAIKPNRADHVALPDGGDRVTFALPPEFRRSDVLVEVRAEGVVRTQAHLANDLRVRMLENYGQVVVQRTEDGAPLPAAYVKVYTRGADGRVRFHKDGYTDLRGRFDYASVSGVNLDGIERFAVLVLSDEHGATVKEVAPPPR
jgi:hypothetical protein